MELHPEDKALIEAKNSEVHIEAKIKELADAHDIKLLWYTSNTWGWVANVTIWRGTYGGGGHQPSNSGAWQEATSRFVTSCQQMIEYCGPGEMSTEMLGVALEMEALAQTMKN